MDDFPYTVPVDSDQNDIHPNKCEGSEGSMDCVTKDALSNYVVLKNIFSFLDKQDLESCCQVNNCWNSIADRLLFRYYDVTLSKYDNVEGTPPHPFVISKQATYNTKEVSHRKHSLPEALECFTTVLEAALQTGKIAINFTVLHSLNDELDTLADFLSNFGVFVERLSPHGQLSSMKLCKALQFFPNLKYLDLSHADFDRTDQPLDAILFKNGMKCLRRIDARATSSVSESLANIFQMAPNLDEIHRFPILFVDALVDAKKAGCVKSLAFPCQESLRLNATNYTFETALEKISNLKLKLRSFSFHYPFVYPEVLLSSTVTQPFLRKILQSSHDSLQTLTLYKSGSFDFEGILPLTGVKEVQFLLKHEKTYAGSCFAPEVVLQKLLPNVCAVSILTEFRYFPIKEIGLYLPENQFIPWGAQIDELKLTDVSLKVLGQLRRIFPSVKTLEFHVGMERFDLQRILLAIGQLWPEVKSLTVVFTFSSYSCRSEINDDKRRIRNFKPASTIGKLSALRTLKFDLVWVLDYKFTEECSTVASILNNVEYLFHPELKIAVRASGDVFRKVSDMKASLKPLLGFEVEIYK